MMKKKFTLGKNERLKSRKLIDELYSKGKRFIATPLQVVYMPAETGLKAGAGVSSRNFKRAVDRNRIKRLIREAYRLQKIPLQELLRSQQKGLVIFFTYTQKEMPEYGKIAAAIQKSLKKLLEKINEKGTPDT